MRVLNKPIRIVSQFMMRPHWYDNDSDLEEALWVLHSQLMSDLNDLIINSDKYITQPFDCEIKIKTRRIRIGDEKAFRKLSYDAPIRGWVFEARAEFYCPNQIRLKLIETGSRSDLSVVQALCRNELNSFISKLCVLLSCFFPGSSECPISRSQGLFAGRAGLGCTSGFHDASSLMLRNGVEPIPSISFEDMLQWSASLNGFWFGLPTTNVARAMNFFSHAHHHDHQVSNLSDLVWVIGGLEALFAESNAEIRQKLIRRPLALAPEITKFSNRKTLGKLYDFRSRFLHGDISIPNLFDADDRRGSYQEEFWAAGDVAAAAFCKSIQALATRGWHNLAFDEVPTGANDFGEQR